MKDRCMRGVIVIMFGMPPCATIFSTLCGGVSLMSLSALPSIFMPPKVSYMTVNKELLGHFSEFAILNNNVATTVKAVCVRACVR
jgi:hypothetical protein